MVQRCTRLRIGEVLFVAITVHCKRCGRTLKNPKSINRGYGIICWRKLGLPLRARVKQELLKSQLLSLESYFGGETSEHLGEVST